MAARKEFPVKVRRVAVTNKKTGVKYIEERRYQYPKSRSKPSRYSSENDVLIEKSVKYTDFFLLSIVYV